ncbi:tyrosine-type recombinase/integrase [Oceanospirillum beijerinckii]|uniref:tyrosine-type recombinase/integrase n=1 Tax=Oceanospirillum beijerinckii TaxID=64976 RepID=UPI0004237A24|nr:site-specific integrase [Oceanospirillum beijerinckii]
MSAAQDNKPLTPLAIKAMKPEDKDLSDTADNRGLRVTCGKTGKKTFFYRYKSPVTKKLTQIKIGVFPDTTLAQARTELHELKKMRDEGKCPKLEKEALLEEQAKEQAEQTIFTVKDVIDLYLTQYIEDRRLEDGSISPGARKPKGQDEVRRTLYSDPVKILGDKPATEVSAREITEMIQKIALDRDAPVQAGNALRELSTAFEFAMSKHIFSERFVNPALQAKSSLKFLKVRLTSKRGDTYLEENELQTFLHWLPGSAFGSTHKDIYRMTLWTGCRTGEICASSWSDFDLEKGILRLQETKTGVKRNVQLPRQAIELLNTLKLSTGDYPFPSQRTGKALDQKYLSMRCWLMRKRGLMLEEIPNWTPHDLRRTVRTGLSRIGCPSEVAEAILGHAKKGIVGTYDLHRYEPECREWLQRWADYMDDLIK